MWIYKQVFNQLQLWNRTTIRFYRRTSCPQVLQEAFLVSVVGLSHSILDPDNYELNAFLHSLCVFKTPFDADDAKGVYRGTVKSANMNVDNYLQLLWEMNLLERDHIFARSQVTTLKDPTDYSPYFFSKLILIVSPIWTSYSNKGGNEILKSRCHPAECI